MRFFDLKPHFSWKKCFLKCYFKGKTLFFRLFSSKCIYGVTYQLTIEFNEKYKSSLKKIKFSDLHCIFPPKRCFFNVILMGKKHILDLLVLRFLYIVVHQKMTEFNQKLVFHLQNESFELKTSFQPQNMFLKCYFKGKILFFRIFFIKMHIWCDLSLNYRIRLEIQIQRIVYKTLD